MVDATVVDAQPPAAMTGPRSRRDAFVTPSAPILPKRSMSAGLRPTEITPSMMAIVAGVAPLRRTTSSTAVATATLRGYGMPCEMIVDSKATTGFPISIALRTTGETLNLGHGGGVARIAVDRKRRMPTKRSRITTPTSFSPASPCSQNGRK